MSGVSSPPFSRSVSQPMTGQRWGWDKHQIPYPSLLGGGYIERGFGLCCLSGSLLKMHLYLLSSFAFSRRRQWHPTPVLLPGKSHGRRSLVGCSPWGREESDMTERLQFHFSLLCVGEGNGNPLQYSCLENPMDGGAW